jgi:hypothetical protein
VASLEQLYGIGKMGEIGLPAATTFALLPQPEWEAIPARVRSQGMDGIRELLETAREHGLASAHFRALLHIAIGRKVTRLNGTVISSGVTWRELAALLKELHFDRELARQSGADPGTLAPRDRERFWYSAIALAHVDSPEVSAAADDLAGPLKKLGFLIGPNPTALAAPSRKAEAKGKAKDDKPTKGKKK